MGPDQYGGQELDHNDTNLTPHKLYVPSDASMGLEIFQLLPARDSQSIAAYTFLLLPMRMWRRFRHNSYGVSGALKADASPEYRSYLRFNVNDLAGPVTSATLRLYTTSSSSIGYQVRQVSSQSWEEGSIPFANAPSVGSVIGSSGNFSSGAWHRRCDLPHHWQWCV
jgi:hypothetical protein